MENSVALRQFNAVYNQASRANRLPADRRDSQGLGEKHVIEAALLNINQLRTDIAGMEAIVEAVKGAVCFTR